MDINGYRFIIVYLYLNMGYVLQYAIKIRCFLLNSGDVQGDGAHGGARLLSLLQIVFFGGGLGGCNSVLWSALSIAISCYFVTSSVSNLQDVPDTL